MQSMMRLDKTLSAWSTPGFADVFKQEVARLDADDLPLQQGLSNSNSVADGPVTVMIHRVAEMEDMIQVQAGIFYQGIISGCNCSDDPSLVNEVNEYCEVLFVIDKSTAATTVALVAYLDE